MPILLLAPRPEAFALPISVERATRRGPREYVISRRAQTPPDVNAAEYILHIHEHLPLLHPDRDRESCEVSERQNQASSKRLSLCLAGERCR